MNLTVIGTGYLGATHAACLAACGHDVVGIDTDPARVAVLGSGRAPFHEPGLDALYSDEDIITAEGRRILPFLKPDFSPEFLLGVMYVGHALCVRRTVVRTLRGASVVVVMRERTPLTESILARLPELELIVTTGSRNASIDLAACHARGITVCGTASRPAPPAELTWALVLGLLRGVPREASAMREGGPWQSTVGRDLAGSTFGVIGLGKIGTRVARVARAFEMDVMAWSPHLTQERADAAGSILSLSCRSPRRFELRFPRSITATSAGWT